MTRSRFLAHEDDEVEDGGWKSNNLSSLEKDLNFRVCTKQEFTISME